MWMGMSIGAAIGAAVGVAMNDVAQGVAMGVALGTAVGAAVAQFWCSAAMRTTILITLALTAQVTVGADKADQMKEAIAKAVVTQELLKDMTYAQVPEKWRTKVEAKSTESITTKLFWRGNQKVLEVLWRKDWTGAKSNMFVAIVFDGHKRIGKIDRAPDTTIHQPKDARLDYSMITTIKDDGRVSVMFTSADGYLQVIEVKDRDTHLMDDIEYTRMAVGSEQIVGPLFEAIDELRTTRPRQNQSKGAEPDGPANGSPPFRAETNRTSSAAGSRR